MRSSSARLVALPLAILLWLKIAGVVAGVLLGLFFGLVAPR